MDRPVIYKKINKDISRTTNNISATEQTQATNIITNFFSYFKTKHTS